MHFIPHTPAQQWVTDSHRATARSGVNLHVGRDPCCNGLHVAMGHAGVTVFGTLTPNEAFAFGAQLMQHALAAASAHTQPQGAH